ncbi:hypothetical protein AVEN_238401-1 [Araneus ventricosus]|uniref:Uncharacterized protein n=1 Tax=Araneus ventricosus TaxID=182803 RepID=A0A4Y2DP97_ARAVE|nr:hypothetical protein AVEN_238401-1 [Araneus ventricosus]
MVKPAELQVAVSRQINHPFSSYTRYFGTDLVFLSHCVVERTTPEPTFPSPNFNNLFSLKRFKEHQLRAHGEFPCIGWNRISNWRSSDPEAEDLLLGQNYPDQFFKRRPGANLLLTLRLVILGITNYEITNC